MPPCFCTASAGTGVCGLVVIAILHGITPFLIPIGLLRALGGKFKLPDGVIEWNDNGSVSGIHYLPSGHPAIDIADGIGTFKQVAPDAGKFARSP